MQLKSALVAAGFGLCLAGMTQPAQAAACVLVALGAIGALGDPDPNQNYTVMSSEVGGASASFTSLITLGSSTVTVAAPTASYLGPQPHGGDQPTIKYRALDLLGFPVKQQDYTNAASSFVITGLIGLVTTTVDARLTNPTGFAQGQYQLKTVVTCS